jgi:hypothetical protein
MNDADFPYEVTYAVLLDGIGACTFGDEGPDYLICGHVTYAALRRWFTVTTNANAKARGEVPFMHSVLKLEGAIVIPLYACIEGWLFPVNMKHCTDPRFCNPIVLPEKKQPVETK